MMTQVLTIPFMMLLAAAPGEPPAAERDVPDIARTAVIRRLEPGSTPVFGRMVVKPGQRMPGYVVCGEFSEHNSGPRPTIERYFVIVPGSFATLERDNKELVSKYWKLNGC